MCKKLTALVLIFILQLKNNEAKVPNFYWRDYVPGDKPCDALQGLDGKYVGQVYEEGFIPATIYPRTHVAIAEQFGRKNVKENIKVLCTPFPHRFYWEDVDFNKSPNNQIDNIVKGGSQHGYNLYVGRTYQDNEWKIGKVIPIENTKSKGLRVWNQKGRAVKALEFQILKYDDKRDVNQTTEAECKQI